MMSTPFSPSEVAFYYRVRVPKLRRTAGRQWRGPCPIHPGKRDSFAVDSETGRWYCHSRCRRGGDIFALEMELTGVGFREAKDEVHQLVGRSTHGE